MCLLCWCKQRASPSQQPGHSDRAGPAPIPLVYPTLLMKKKKSCISSMELSDIGERVYAAESLLNRRIRRVTIRIHLLFFLFFFLSFFFIIIFFFINHYTLLLSCLPSPFLLLYFSSSSFFSLLPLLLLLLLFYVFIIFCHLYTILKFFSSFSLLFRSPSWRLHQKHRFFLIQVTFQTITHKSKSNYSLSTRKHFLPFYFHFLSIHPSIYISLYHSLYHSPFFLSLMFFSRFLS